MNYIDNIRAFNRFYTRRLGILDRSYLQSNMTLTEVRILYDLATNGPLTARDLVEDLGLDEGYLSRLITRFRKLGWIDRQRDTHDRRRWNLSLTREGKALTKTLITFSRKAIEESLSHLEPTERLTLVKTMHRLQAMLDPGTLKNTVFRDLEIGDAGWIVARHAELYAIEEGYDASFEALVARLLAGFIETRDMKTERAFIPVANGVRLGSVFCMRDDPDTARLRMFFLEPFARGLGLGKLMLEEVVNFATITEAKRLVLWTHKSHHAACSLYAARGFKITSESPANAFGQDAIDQIWELTL